MSDKKLAVITGASTGIGFELAKLCAKDGFDLIVAADEPLERAAGELRQLGVEVKAVEADLSGAVGVDELCRAIGKRPVDALLANAGRGLGHGFLDQAPAKFMRVVETNVTGTILLVHKIGNRMRERGEGRILITGSIAGLMPGSFQAVYNGTKAFLDSFAVALRNELKDSGVVVACLLPGATDTQFFARAEMLDTEVGQAKKDDPADVAKTGYDAMMKDQGSVVHGLKNKVQAAVAHVAPDTFLAEMHRKQAEPGAVRH